MFALINNGIVVQVQPNEETGFVAVPAGTVCGMVQNADGTFSAPGPSLAQAQSSQIALLRSACQSAITGGFTSSALGSAYNYPSDSNTQANINSAAGNPSGGEIRCTLTPTALSWPLVAHTQAQAQTVLTALMAWVNGCQNKLDTLIAQVNAATTVAAVQAVVWVNP